MKRNSTIQDVLRNNFLVKTNGSTGAMISLPKSMLGKRVKIILNDDIDIEKRCWICKRTEEELEEIVIDNKGNILSDYTELCDIRPENDAIEDVGHLKVKLCLWCGTLLNGFIDRRFGCLEDCKK